MDADPDRDGLPNLVEYLLGSPPASFSQPFTGSFAPGKTLSFPTNAIGLRFGNLIAEETTNLAVWTPVPAARTSTAADGRITVWPAAGGRSFVRLRGVARQ